MENCSAVDDTSAEKEKLFAVESPVATDASSVATDASSVATDTLSIGTDTSLVANVFPAAMQSFQFEKTGSEMNHWFHRNLVAAPVVGVRPQTLSDCFA